VEPFFHKYFFRNTVFPLIISAYMDFIEKEPVVVRFHLNLSSSSRDV
jgi:hypothetical protein